MHCRASRTLQDAVGCVDHVPGGDDTAAKVPAGGAATVAAYQSVGPIYIVGSAEVGWPTVLESLLAIPGPEAIRHCHKMQPHWTASLQDADSPQGPSQYELELWQEGSSGSDGQQRAAVTSATGCATTPVVDSCPTPAAVSILLRCLNADRPCRVRVAAYMSGCTGGPQPQAVAVGDSSESDSSESSGTTGAAAASPTPATASGSPSTASSGSGSVNSGGSSSGGISSTTWIIIGVSVGSVLVAGRASARIRASSCPWLGERGACWPALPASSHHTEPAFWLAALAIWCACWRKRRQRAAADLESGAGAGYQQQKPQQQFLVSGGAGGMQQQQQQWQPLQHGGPTKPPAAPVQVVQAASGAATGLVAPPSWSFAYKVAARRLAFATDVGRCSGLLQQWSSIDEWLGMQLAGMLPTPRGCLMYNDDPPEARPDGSPTGDPGTWVVCPHGCWPGSAFGHVCSFVMRPFARDEAQPPTTYRPRPAPPCLPAGQATPVPPRTAPAGTARAWCCGTTAGWPGWCTLCPNGPATTLPRPAGWVPGACRASRTARRIGASRSCGRCCRGRSLPRCCARCSTCRCAGGLPGLLVARAGWCDSAASCCCQRGCSSGGSAYHEVLICTAVPQALVYHTSDPHIWPHPPGDYAKAQGLGFLLADLRCLLGSPACSPLFMNASCHQPAPDSAGLPAVAPMQPRSVAPGQGQ